jgi:hypothetical protein
MGTTQHPTDRQARISRSDWKARKHEALMIVVILILSFPVVLSVLGPRCR